MITKGVDIQIVILLAQKKLFQENFIKDLVFVAQTGNFDS